MEIGERIREKRTKLGLTLEEVAKHLKTSKQTVQRYETGEISNIPSDKIEKLAEVLDTTPSYLMGWINLDFNDKIDDTPFNKAINGENLTMEDIEVIYEELPKILQNSNLRLGRYHNDLQKMRLTLSFDKLNILGKEEAVKRVNELTYIPEYCEDDHLMVNAAHAIDGASEEDIEHDNDIMDDDEFWEQ